MIPNTFEKFEPGLTREWVTGLFDSYNTHNVDRLIAHCWPDYVGVDVGRALPQNGVEDLRATLLEYLQAFPDMVVKPKDTIIEKNSVVQVWTAHGTHRGQLMNIPPTGRTVSVDGISVLTVLNGKVKRGLHIWDLAGLLRSIGLLPELS